MNRVILLLLLFTFNTNWAQQIITESLGTVSGNTSIAAHEAGNGFDNDDLTYSGTGDLRITTPSPSGGANVFLTASPATPRTFIIGNLKTNAAVTSITVDFSAFKSISAANNDLVVDYTVNGTTYLDPQVVNITTGSSWTTQSITFSAPPAGVTAIRFTNIAVASATVQYRIDALTITANGSGAALPIKLTQFGLSRNGNDVNLRWTTSTETNNDYFTIEHSTDGKNFEAIGNVKGNGTTSVKNTYGFIHKNAPNGLSHYRLTQVDFDGRSETFETKSINISRNAGVKAYPSVTSDYITIDNPEGESIALYDINGKLQINVKGEEKLDLTNLVSGVYFLKTQNETIKIRKL